MAAIADQEKTDYGQTYGKPQSNCRFQSRLTTAIGTSTKIMFNFARNINLAACLSMSVNCGT